MLHNIRYIIFASVFLFFMPESIIAQDNRETQFKNSTSKETNVIVIPPLKQEGIEGKPRIVSTLSAEERSKNKLPEPTIVKIQASQPVFVSGQKTMIGPENSSQIYLKEQTENNWMTQAKIDISEKGMVETVLPPGLHRAASSKPRAQTYPIDLCLLGPDGKQRAFELFWREKGETEKLTIEASSLELWDDKRLVWEGIIDERLKIENVIITIADQSYVGKVDIQGQTSSGWKWLVKNAALYKTEKSNVANIKVDEGEYQKLRLYFSGYDKEYHDTPVFVEKVQITGERPGRDYVEDIFSPQIEEKRNDNTVEIRATLPGSGIWIDEIEITTSALFIGTWSIGLEAIIAGKQDYTEFKKGAAPFIDKGGQSFSIKIERQVQGRVMIVKLESPDYFGEIQDFKVKARLPRMVFFADQEGTYTARAGWGKLVNILERETDIERETDHEVRFSDVEKNRLWRPESMIEDYDIKGGPFDINDFTWKAGVHVDEPGFYRLILNERAALESNRTGLRLVKDNRQIPYFIGREEIKKTDLEAVADYDDKNNRTSLILKLPYASSQWSALQLTSQGIFKRPLVFEKHEPGKVGWQPWVNDTWTSNEKDKSEFTLNLNDFPPDQTEIRLIIDNGDNEPIIIEKVQAFYRSQDLLFLASETGDYDLMGGNPESFPASYDLSMIEDNLLSIVPKQVEIVSLEPLQSSNEIDTTTEKGGPFDDSGYTWVSDVPIGEPGFFRLLLNQHASLDQNRVGLRLVKDGSQVPYFMGEISKRTMTPEFETEYIEKENKTITTIKLPQASSHWHSIELTAKGIFDRDLVLEVPNPGRSGWQYWTGRNWSNHDKGDSNLEIKLMDYPAGETDIRIIIDHGDNHPLEISKVQAIYDTQDLFFIAREKGEYQLAGGNPKATAPSYDLSLLKDSLLKTEPIEIKMEEIESFRPAAWETRLNDIFSEQGWGLYAVLGAVTLILLIIIVRLFPQEKKE